MSHGQHGQRWNLREFTASCKVVPLGRATFWMLKLVNFHRCPCCPCDIKVPYSRYIFDKLWHWMFTLCLPKTEISVFQRPTLACQRRRFPPLWRNVCFSHPHVTNYICSHCMMCYTVRKKKCSSLFWYKAIMVWFCQFIMTVVQN